MGLSLTKAILIIARERICLAPRISGKHRRGDETNEKNKDEGFWINEFHHA